MAALKGTVIFFLHLNHRLFLGLLSGPFFFFLSFFLLFALTVWQEVL